MLRASRSAWHCPAPATRYRAACLPRAVALTCGVAVVVWVLGRRADMWLIRRRQSAIAAYLADPTQG